jgi:hypothetical protein
MLAQATLRSQADSMTLQTKLEDFATTAKEEPS